MKIGGLNYFFNNEITAATATTEFTSKIRISSLLIKPPFRRHRQALALEVKIQEGP